MKYIKEYRDYSTINFILNESVSETINEGIVDRIKEASKKGLLTKNVIKNLIKKGVLTTSVITALMTTDPGFAKAYNSVKSDDISIVDTNNNPGESIDISKSFNSGEYELSEEGVADLDTKLTDLLKTATSNTQYTLTIIASESKVPNKGMAPKELANKRADNIRQHISEFLNSNNYNIGLKIDIQTKIGSNKWTPGEDVNQDKFKKDQYVKILMVKGDSETSFCGWTTPPDTKNKLAQNNVGLDKKFNVTNLHGSGVIDIRTGSIPDRLLVYSDNVLIGDTGFMATETHKDLGKHFTYTPRNILQLTKLYKNNNAAVQSTKYYKTNVKTVKTFDELELLMLKDKSKLHNTWNGYDEDVTNPIKELKAMFDSGQRDFVFYENKKQTLRYSLDGSVKNVRVLVYSALEKTDFEIKVNCTK